MEIDLQKAYDEYENLSDEEKEMIRKVNINSSVNRGAKHSP